MVWDVRDERWRQTMRDPDTGRIIDPAGIGDGPLTEEQQVYKENIIDHYKHPRNKKHVQEATVVRAGVNPSCGDSLQVSIIVHDGVVQDFGFEGKGCAISQAAMSMVSERIIGLPADEVMRMTREDVAAMLGIPIGIVRMKCAMLGLRTTQAAIKGMPDETSDSAYEGKVQ
jgi:nitrogen fixation NifU-like protein